jgi:hypothetical protein
MCDASDRGLVRPLHEPSTLIAWRGERRRHGRRMPDRLGVRDGEGELECRQLLASTSAAGAGSAFRQPQPRRTARRSECAPGSRSLARLCFNKFFGERVEQYDELSAECSTQPNEPSAAFLASSADPEVLELGINRDRVPLARGIRSPDRPWRRWSRLPSRARWNQ